MILGYTQILQAPTNKPKMKRRQAVNMTVSPILAKPHSLLRLPTALVVEIATWLAPRSLGQWMACALEFHALLTTHSANAAIRRAYSNASWEVRGTPKLATWLSKQSLSAPGGERFRFRASRHWVSDSKMDLYERMPLWTGLLHLEINNFFALGPNTPCWPPNLTSLWITTALPGPHLGFIFNRFTFDLWHATKTCPRLCDLVLGPSVRLRREESHANRSLRHLVHPTCTGLTRLVNVINQIDAQEYFDNNNDRVKLEACVPFANLASVTLGSLYAPYYYNVKIEMITTFLATHSFASLVEFSCFADRKSIHLFEPLRRHCTHLHTLRLNLAMTTTELDEPIWKWMVPRLRWLKLKFYRPAGISAEEVERIMDRAYTRLFEDTAKLLRALYLDLSLVRTVSHDIRCGWLSVPSLKEELSWRVEFQWCESEHIALPASVRRRVAATSMATGEPIRLYITCERHWTETHRVDLEMRTYAEKCIAMTQWLCKGMEPPVVPILLVRGKPDWLAKMSKYKLPIQMVNRLPKNAYRDSDLEFRSGPYHLISD